MVLPGVGGVAAMTIRKELCFLSRGIVPLLRLTAESVDVTFVFSAIITLESMKLIIRTSFGYFYSKLKQKLWKFGAKGEKPQGRLRCGSVITKPGREKALSAGLGSYRHLLIHMYIIHMNKEMWIIRASY